MDTDTWKQKIEITEAKNISRILFPNNGFGIVFIQKEKNVVAHFIPINEAIQIANTQNEKILVLLFDRDFIEEDDPEYALDILNLFNLTKNQRLPLSNYIWSELEKVFKLLKKEYEKINSSYLIVKSFLKIILLNLIRYQKGKFLEQDLQQKRVYTFLKLMEQNYQTHNTANFYAKELGVSPKRLNQILKGKLNLTAKQIIQQRCVTEIKRELRNSNISIKEIAYQFHFNSSASFSRFFKKFEGRSPKEFRETHQQ
ncbi:helix-turn-helix domain-containing protein [Zunongwangia endophytica]|uniref:Helix-turn-helix domain-containing protein n=1 Tax=Zunongwangia endophytica TaxID=1808945 RepID=A0ABV8HCA1_9FLAO|nr:AraC family transcriptional regulator [Zunongwangia endophytica]MDN3596227.1 AraC family transcriptional regulator [Zunongwangia endophytica]